jgi:hypothetical protein
LPSGLFAAAAKRNIAPRQPGAARRIAREFAIVPSIKYFMRITRMILTVTIAEAY